MSNTGNNENKTLIVITVRLLNEFYEKIKNVFASITHTHKTSELENDSEFVKKSDIPNLDVVTTDEFKEYLGIEVEEANQTSSSE